MTPVITAIVGAVVVLLGTLVARNATRYAAELAAVQRRRDAELAHLREFRDALIDALAHLSSYRHALSRLAADTTAEDRVDAAMRVLERTGGREAYRFEVAESLERLRNLANGLLWRELHAAYSPLGSLLAGAGSLHEIAVRIEENSPVLEAFVDVLSAHHRHLLRSYPVRP